MLNFHLFSISKQVVFFFMQFSHFIIDCSVLRVLYSTFRLLAACVIYKYFLSVNKVSLCAFLCVSVDAHMPRCLKTILGVCPIHLPYMSCIAVSTRLTCPHASGHDSLVSASHLTVGTLTFQLHTWLHVDSGDSISSPHMCAANALPNEQHRTPKPKHVFYSL